MIKQISASLLVLLSLAMASNASDKPPQIIHEPVKAAIKGQPVYIRATVRDDQGAVKAVNLFCSVSSDSAPFKVQMRSSGAGAYIAAIPDNLAQNGNDVSYYIEAIDSVEQSTETPWYTIKFKATQPGAVQPSEAGSERKTSWKKPLLITAGAAAAVGAGFAIAGSGGSGGDDSDNPPENSGLYAGSATRYFQMAGGALTSETYNVVLNLLENGTITSDTLHPGDNLSATVVANSFTMVGAVNSNGMSGSVIYNGSIAGTTINGSISGTVVSSTGTNGTYSGIFSAREQP